MDKSKGSLTGMAIIIGCYFLGDLVSSIPGVPLPGNLLGLVILLIGLVTGVISLELVDRAADFFVQNLALLLVPLAVGIMGSWSIIARQWMAVLVSTLVSTFIVMGVTGLVLDKLLKGESRDAARDF